MIFGRKERRKEIRREGISSEGKKEGMVGKYCQNLMPENLEKIAKILDTRGNDDNCYT